MESDPIGLIGGLSTYLYASAAPISAIDPQGLEEIRMICIPGIKCFPAVLPDMDKVGPIVIKDPRDVPSKLIKLWPKEICADYQPNMDLCKLCCTRMTWLTKDVNFTSKCVIACNDKFACTVKPKEQVIVAAASVPSRPTFPQPTSNSGVSYWQREGIQ